MNRAGAAAATGHLSLLDQSAEVMTKADDSRKGSATARRTSVDMDSVRAASGAMPLTKS
jgi:hypothetical protein